MADSHRIEFRDHGLEDIISLQHRNVCKDGFGDVKGVEAGERHACRVRPVLMPQSSWICQRHGRRYRTLSAHYGYVFLFASDVQLTFRSKIK